MAVAKFFKKRKENKMEKRITDEVKKQYSDLAGKISDFEYDVAYQLYPREIDQLDDAYDLDPSIGDWTETSFWRKIFWKIRGELIEQLKDEMQNEKKEFLTKKE